MHGWNYFLLIPPFTCKQESKSESTDIQGERYINGFMISKRKPAESPLVMGFPSAVDMSGGEKKKCVS